MGGMFVGMSVGATTVWKPLSCGMSSTGGCSSGFFCSWFRNTIVVSTTGPVEAWPAVSVAMTASTTTSECPTRDTKPSPKAFFVSALRLDSIRVSNTPQPPRLVAYVIVRPTANPLVGRRLQNDDSRVRLVRSRRSVKSMGMRTRTRTARRAGATRPGLGIAARERHRERRATARPALDLDGSPMGFGDPLADGEAEAGAGARTGAGARRVGAPEAVEDVRQVA